MFDKAKANEISADIIAALAEVEKKHNIKIKNKGGRFSAEVLDLKLQLTANSADGSTQTAEALAWSKWATLFDLNVDDLGKQVTINGTRYKLAGLKPKSRKYPIIATRISDGKGFKMPVDAVKHALKKEHA